MSWSDKYKKSIDCNNPKGFSQKAHCAGRKKNMKEFKDFFKESIIDIPRKTYARPVFDNEDTGNPKLKPSVRQQVLDGIKTFEKIW
tara:strand:- start:223 stop:480 length:258 start_codon:yes stop_codon:yes gene_type:complete